MFRESGISWTGRRFIGEVDGYFVEAQVFDEPSSYGIAKGRISHLYVYPDHSSDFNRRLLGYERGWEGGPPQDRRLQRVVEQAVNYFDRQPVDWMFEMYRYRDSRD